MSLTPIYQEVIMKQSKNLVASLLLLTFVLSCVGCGSKKEVTCPFTEITWENTLEDVQALEGELQDSYYSSFKGTTYVYEKEYLGLKGSIKYMFDAEDNLRSVAWLYLPESKEDLENVYADLVKQTNKLYGESGFNSDMSTAKGAVWYSEGGNILIGVMSTGVNEAVQYQFFHPEVSSKEPANNQNNSKSYLEKIFNN